MHMKKILLIVLVLILALLSIYVYNIVQDGWGTIKDGTTPPSYSGEVVSVSWAQDDYQDEFDEQGEFDPSQYEEEEIDELMWLLEELIENEQQPSSVSDTIQTSN